MSVYIKGIEMPKGYSVVVKIFPDGRVGMVPYIQYFKADLIEGAQAVPVPPHGRLINEKDIIPKDGYIIADGMACISVKDIANAPTIIPASEEGEA